MGAEGPRSGSGPSDDDDDSDDDSDDSSSEESSGSSGDSDDSSSEEDLELEDKFRAMLSTPEGLLNGYCSQSPEIVDPPNRCVYHHPPPWLAPACLDLLADQPLARAVHRHGGARG